MSNISSKLVWIKSNSEATSRYAILTATHVETTENVSNTFLKWEKLHFNIFENIGFHVKVHV